MSLENLIRIPLETLAESVAGAVELERFDDGFAPQRLPAWTRRQYADAGIGWVSGNTAGVRLRLSTAATRIRFQLRFIRNASSTQFLPPFPITMLAEDADTILDRVDLDEGDLILESPDHSVRHIPGERSLVDLVLGGDGRRERAVDVWLPHAAQTIIHGAEADTTVRAALPVARPRWIHYGSSISHGLEADGPLGPWPQQVSRDLHLDLLNLGLAGNAMLDPFVARVIAAQPADVITLKVGINLVNADSMRIRTFIPALHGFLDTVRAGHPTTPIVVISAIASPFHESIPGPTREATPGRYAGTPRPLSDIDGSLTLERTRSLVSAVVTARAADDALGLLNGLSLLGLDDMDLLYDDLHPNQAGHDLIADRFATLARNPDTPLGVAFSPVLDRTPIDSREGKGARRFPASPGSPSLTTG